MRDLDKMLLKRKNSSRIAVADDDRDWSYSDFVRYVFFAKNYFVKHGIQKLVIDVPQGFYAYALIWGAYLAGTTYCPISVGVPINRKVYYINIFSADLIIHTNHGEYQVAIATSTPISFFSSISNKIKNCQTILNGNDTAYVIFTSGSTGIPKGVRVSRKGLENLLMWTTRAYEITEDDRWGQYSNLGFDLSMCDIFTAVICGCALIPVAKPAQKLLPGLTIKKKGITFWCSTPSVIDLLGRYGHLTNVYLGSIRMMTFCGEKLFPSQLAALFQANPNMVVYNTYGPTEITIFCTYLRLTSENYLNHSDITVSIGVAIPGYVIELQNIKSGIGEILVIGDFIAQGYLSDFEQDAKSHSPFSTYNGVRSYQTGDFAEYKHGQLYFVTREDTQVKILGQRVDLFEIDHKLRQLGCTACISTIVSKKIVTFIATDRFSEQDIRLYISENLPAYYQPAKIFILETLPYNINGKIDILQLINLVK